MLLPVVLVAMMAATLHAQNFPPVAAAAATPEEVKVNQPIAFSSVGSFDPDNGPEPLSYLWDFGDGSTSAEPNPSKAFAVPRAYQVSLTVSDGFDSTVDSVTVHVLGRPTAAPPTASSMLALSPDNRSLWVANPDADSVTVLDVETFSKIAEISVGKNPRTVALDPVGGRVFVTCQGSDNLWVLNASNRQVIGRVPVGRGPFGVALAPGSRRIVVSIQDEDTVMLLAPDSAIQNILPVGDSPRVIAITADGARAFVSHFISRREEGLITEIDLLTSAVVRVIPLAHDAGPDTPSSGRGVPNLLSALSIEPSGLGLWVGGLKSNSRRGLFLNGLELAPENTVRGFFGRINLDVTAEEMERRIDSNNADSISALAFSPNGRFAYVTHQGAEALAVYDLSAATLIPPGDGSTVPVESRLDVGSAPQAVLLSSNGLRAYVANFLSRSISIFDLGNPRQPLLLTNLSVTAEPLPASIANGKRLFYRSRAPKHSKDNYISCASCHADGAGHDGRTWDFTQRGEGLRNTTDLRGRTGLGHGPVHWSANFDEIQDFENDIVNQFGGTGLAQDGQTPNPPLGESNSGRSGDLDDLAAYVASLQSVPRSPHRRYDGTLTPGALRGKTLFNDPDVGCATCHAPPRFTDSSLENSPNFTLHNVGTLTPASGKRLGEPLTGIDTPTLIGLWDTAPYLHDGSARTLSDVLARNTNDQHGVISFLSNADRADLVEYLMSIDGSPADEFTDYDGDGMHDFWEIENGLNPAKATDASADLDRDGLSNLKEYLTGTDPTEPGAGLGIRHITRQANSMTFTFPTVRGFIYQVQYAASLRDGWLELLIFPGDGTEKLMIDSNETNHTRFYRIEAR